MRFVNEYVFRLQILHRKIQVMNVVQPIGNLIENSEYVFFVSNTYLTQWRTNVLGNDYGPFCWIESINIIKIDKLLL